MSKMRLGHTLSLLRQQRAVKPSPGFIWGQPKSSESGCSWVLLTGSFLVETLDFEPNVLL